MLLGLILVGGRGNVECPLFGFQGNIALGTKDLDLISGGNITFTPTGALVADLTTGDVTLTTGASYRIIGANDADADVTSNTLKVTGGSVGFGTDADLFRTKVNFLATDTITGNGQQYLAQDATVSITVNTDGLGAGTANITLEGWILLHGTHRQYHQQCGGG